MAVAAWIVLTPAAAHAQAYENVGIRAQGMAGAFVAVADDATSTWWNPAGLATGAYLSGIVEIDRGGDSRRSSGVAISFPALGLSYYRLRLNQVQAPDSTASTASASGDRQDPRTAGPGFSRLDLDQFGASVGQSIGDHFVVASTLKLVNARSITRGDVDVGAMAAFGFARVGVSMRNLTRLEFGGGIDRVRLDRQARAGFALTAPARGGIDQLTLALDADITNSPTISGTAHRFAAGAEAWVLGRRIGMRGGAGGGSGAAGASVALATRLYVDAAIGHQGWGLDLRVTF